MLNAGNRHTQKGGPIMVANTSVAKTEERGLTKLWCFTFAAIMFLGVIIMCTVVAHADLADDVNTAASSVYSDVVKVSTPLAVVSIAVALLFTYFSHNPKVVDASRTTAKGIAITWVVIMILGALFTYGKGIVSKISGGTSIPTIQNSGNNKEP